MVLRLLGGDEGMWGVRTLVCDQATPLVTLVTLILLGCQDSAGCGSDADRSDRTAFDMGQVVC